MRLKSSTIYLTDENENECEYSVILTFDTDENNRYIVYTKDEVDEDGFIKTYAGKVDGEVLKPIKDDNIWQLIENLLNKIDN